MILYHGSTVPVEKPEIRISESFLDFGTGFYTTTSLQQAERWARKMCIRDRNCSVLKCSVRHRASSPAAFASPNSQSVYWVENGSRLASFP